MFWTVFAGTSSGQLLVFSVPAKGGNITFEEYLSGRCFLCQQKKMEALIIQCADHVTLEENTHLDSDLDSDLIII